LQVLGSRVRTVVSNTRMSFAVAATLAPELASDTVMATALPGAVTAELMSMCTIRGVAVGVEVGVRVGVTVGVREGVRVGVKVGVKVLVGVGVVVGVRVDVAVGPVGVKVGVGVLGGMNWQDMLSDVVVTLSPIDAASSEPKALTVEELDSPPSGFAMAASQSNGAPVIDVTQGKAPHWAPEAIFEFATLLAFRISALAVPLVVARVVGSA